jgi:hypothetical protein
MKLRCKKNEHIHNSVEGDQLAGDCLEGRFDDGRMILKWV